MSFPLLAEPQQNDARHTTLTRDVCFCMVTSSNEVRRFRDKWQLLSDRAILVLGSPRSGTSWLAKIFDSHPDVLYRHEPDELTPPTPGLDPAEQVRRWLRERGLRVAAKRPYFRKSWRPVPLDRARLATVGGLALACRVPVVSRSAGRIGIPDLVVPNRWQSVRGAAKLVNWDGSLAARAMPNARCVFILRHPGGQVASVMAGHAAKQLGRASDFSTSPAADLAAAAVCAERSGINAATFGRLSEAAKHAWCWRAFNEPAVDALGDLPNARIVIYEDLCRDPETVAQDLFAFAGLDWHGQSAAFLASSTKPGRTESYFDVFRSTGVVADRWRRTMSPADQDAVRTVLSTSRLAHRWPDAAVSAG
jgi:hypothetical protein